MTSNYSWGLPIAASTIAKDIDFGIYLIHAAMILIFVGWGIFFTYLLIRYRRREGVKAHVSHDNALLSLLPDFAVLIFEIGLIALYAIPKWSRIKMSTPDPAISNLVHVMAEQFAWDVQYPGKDKKFGKKDPLLVNSSNPMGIDNSDPAAADDIVTINELHIPLGKPTLMTLTSKDVIHSFFIPEFRIKQDAMPGMAIPVWFEPTEEGCRASNPNFPKDPTCKFELVCAQLCGVGHATMRADVIVHTPEDYEKWQKGNVAAPPAAASATTDF